MKTIYTKRIRKKNTGILGTYFLPSELSILVDFGKGNGKLKLGLAFIADAIEFYLTHLIRRGLSAAKVRKK